jgi:hypothetical protein
LFFKYSLNNFLHAQVEECIRLVFAWNSNSLNQVDESPVDEVVERLNPNMRIHF